MKTIRLRSIHDQRHRQMVQLLTKARLDAGISQSELASAIGLKQPDISKIETNERRVDIIEFLDILGYIAKQTNDLGLLMASIEKILETEK